MIRIGSVFKGEGAIVGQLRLSATIGGTTLAHSCESIPMCNCLPSGSSYTLGTPPKGKVQGKP
jgi:hypothetical protein